MQLALLRIRAAKSEIFYGKIRKTRRDVETNTSLDLNIYFPTAARRRNSGALLRFPKSRHAVICPHSP
ncbi:hypothetical protein [Rhizobium sp. CCGE 510]|uniref:hypothetical protein n=1 Tax=Rhizobium sp. CCGE 510 TaxID=1132836 RepID=UPI00027B7EE1|nr:hypothetical protein [Rhizobium sp. CCGE 510]EJT03503.1 hypothetical protein RCCGE510_18723 [Rhizobium sp. CCGE 510]